MNETRDETIRILVVDDDHEVADILKDLVSSQDRIVHACYDGLTAIRNIQENPYDLVIVDLMMPKVGGIEVLRYARQAKSDVVVMIITGYASLETAITAIQEGAYDYIRKPCKLEEFQIAVNNAVEKIKLNREKHELLEKLQQAYRDLESLKREKGEGGKIASVNFFSSNMPGLHYLYDDRTLQDRMVEQLQTLTSMKEKGLLEESEFRALKDHFFKTVRGGRLD
jgi:DNA-binding response OmpR family regulator